MNDELTATLVCLGLLAAMFGFNQQKRSARRQAQSYGDLYQPASKAKDEPSA